MNFRMGREGRRDEIYDRLNVGCARESHSGPPAVYQDGQGGRRGRFGGLGMSSSALAPGNAKYQLVVLVEVK